MNINNEISPQKNHLLAALPPQIQKRLLPYLKLEFFPVGKVLYESGHALHQVYFPIDSIVSLLYVTESGSSAEISMVGYEGLVGIAVLMGGEKHHQSGAGAELRPRLQSVRAAAAERVQ